ATNYVLECGSGESCVADGVEDRAGLGQRRPRGRQDRGQKGDRSQCDVLGTCEHDAYSLRGKVLWGFGAAVRSGLRDGPPFSAGGQGLKIANARSTATKAAVDPTGAAQSHMNVS